MLNSQCVVLKLATTTSTPPEIFGLKGSSAKELHLRAEQARYYMEFSGSIEALERKLYWVKSLYCSSW